MEQASRKLDFTKTTRFSSFFLVTEHALSECKTGNMYTCIPVENPTFLFM